MSTEKPQIYDLTAELSLSPEQLANILKNYLSEKYQIQTSSIEEKADSFSSTRTAHGFYNAVIKAIPAYFHWSLEKITENKSRIYITFHLPRWLVIYFIIIYVVLGILFHLTPWITICNNSLGNSDWLLYLAFFNFCLTGLVLLALMIIYMSLIHRYRRFGQHLLETATYLHHKDSSLLRIIWHDRHYRSFMNTKLLFFIFGIILSPVIYIDVDDIASSLSPENIKIFLSIGFILVMSFWLLYTIRQEKKHAPLLASRMKALVHNMSMSLCIALFLLVVPVSKIYVGESSQFEQQNMKCWTYNQAFIQLVQSEDPEIPREMLLQEISDNFHRIRMFSLILLGIQLLFLIPAVCFFVFCSLGFRSFLEDLHRQEIKKAYQDQLQKTPLQHTTFCLPLSTRIIIGFFYSGLSILCWVGILTNISILVAIFSPDTNLPLLKDGAIIIRQSLIFSYAWLGYETSPIALQAFRLVFLAPALVPFLLYMYLHLKAYRKARSELRALEPLHNDLARKADDIARHFMKLNSVRCCVNPSYGKLTPYADIRGWRPDPMIVFSQNGIRCLNNYPDISEAILAHELAHLKYHCFKHRWLRIISRLGMQSIGSLSIYVDSLAEGDEADQIAQSYLAHKGENTQLVNQAAHILALEETKWNMSSSKTPSAAFAESSKTDKIYEHDDSKYTMISKIWSAFKVAYKFYFEADLYDYMHREAKYRGL